MSNTTNSEIRIKEIGGINFGEAFKNGQITSTFSIPASLSITSLTDEEKAERESKANWAAYKASFKKRNNLDNERYKSLSPSELINATKNKNASSLSDILGSAKSIYDTITNAPDVISKSIVFSPIPFVLNKRIVGTRPSNFLLGKEFLREIILSLIETPIPFMQLKPNMIEPSLIEYVSTD